MSISNVLERRPDNICIIDSFKHGIGGFSLLTGRAFRFKIPPHLRFKVSNNILECLAEIVATWLGIIEGELVEHACAFSVTDNTSAIGWTHKSNFCDSAKKPHLMFGRNLAELTINSKIYLHIQHIKG